MQREDVSTLLVDAARLIDAQEVTQLDEDEWLFVVADAPHITLQRDPVEARLMLTADLGELQAATPASRLELLLAYNAAWPQHGGLCIAFDLARRQLLLQLAVPLEGLSLQRLARVLGVFSQAAAAWAQALDSTAAAAPVASGSLEALLSFGGIRA